MRPQQAVSIAILFSLGTLIPGGVWAQVGFTVVPNANETVEGNSDNCFPWFCFTAVRYQQVHLGSEVGSGTITGIRFRQDGLLGHEFTAFELENVTIVFSSTTAAPDGLSTTFSNNVGPDETVVFSGNLMLSSASSTAIPRPFDVSINLSPPFEFAASAGTNLLIDVIVPQTVLGSALDFESMTGDSISRVICFDDPGCLTTGTATFADSGGLVTQFVIDTPVIFLDGLESGDTSAWSVVVP